MPTVTEALDALHELPSIYQAVGNIAHRVRRCRDGSKLSNELLAAYSKLNRDGSRKSSQVALTLDSSYPRMLEKLVLALLKERGGGDFNEVVGEDGNYYIPYNVKERIKRQHESESA